MQAQAQPSERKRRDWIIILIILLFGFLCVFIAGQWAVRFSPTWRLNTNMGSNLDPNSIFLTNVPVNYIEPLDPAILTQPVWVNVFLTPGALANTQTPAPTTSPVSTIPVTVTTVAPTQTSTDPTATRTVPPATNTAIYIPPTRTFTPNPSAVNVDLQITKTDGVATYTGGSPVIYTIVVSNTSSNNVTGAIVSDPKPSQVTTWSWACTSQTNGANGCSPMLGNTNFTDTVNLPGNSSITYTVTANIAVSATGNLVNTASVTVPSGYNDTNNANNSATDTDTQYIPSADLQITKTDTPASTVYIAGAPITYTITVSNPTGPDDVVNATVTDTFSANLTGITWTCVPSGTGASCATGSSSDDINDTTVDLPVGTFVTYTINATISGSTTGPLSNTATVAVPSGFTDPNTGNNSSTDTNSQVSVDLQITKTDGVTDVDPSAITTYTIRVTNGGPNNVTGAILSDPVATGLTKTVVACSVTDPGQCVTPPDVTQLQSGTFALPTLNNGQFYEITVSATVNATSGSVTNIADVDAPAGTTDPDTDNNSDSDTNAVNLVADLGVTNTNNSVVYTANAVKTYTIVFSNSGPSDVTGATIQADLTDATNILSATWLCSEAGGALCIDPNGSNDISYINLVDLPAGSSLTYTVTLTVTGSPVGQLQTTASISAPVGVTESGPNPNSATDSDELPTPPYGGLDFGSPPNPDEEPFGDGSSTVIALPTSIVVVGGEPAYDLVYYEEEINVGGNPGVAMDWVILEIGDGTTWYTVFYWGDGGSDGNTNVAIPLVGNGAGDGDCNGEPDNCNIDGNALPPLLDGNGITIDVDSLGIPPGSYPYLRIRVPSGTGSSNDGVSIEGFYIP